MCKISVIVAVYNVSKYLKQCLESLKNQTFKDFEVIIVDDGSTDGCFDVYSEYTKNDDRFLSFKKENGGLASARIFGAEKARGEYVINIDGDDFLSVDALKELYANATEFNADVAVCGYYKYYGENNSEININKPKGYCDKERIKSELIERVVPGTDDEIIYPAVWIKLIRTSLYKENLKYYSEKMSMAEDVAITVPNICGANGVVFIDKPLYYYRQSETQMSAKYKDCYFDSEMLVENAIAEFGKSINYDFTYQLRRRYVNFAFWQIKLAIGSVSDEKELKRILDQWCDKDAVKCGNTKGYSLKEKLKKKLLKKKSVALIKLF